MNPVNALPSSKPEYGHGVNGILRISASGDVQGKLSGAGKLVFSGSMSCIGDLANGDPKLAVGKASFLVIAGTAYLVARAVAEDTTKVVLASATELIKGAGDLIPLFGEVLGLMFEYNGAAGAKGDDYYAQQAAKVFSVVTEGTGPNNEILPCDVFMASGESQDASQRYNGVEHGIAAQELYDHQIQSGSNPNDPYYKKRHDRLVDEWHNAAAFGQFLTILENPEPAQDNWKLRKKLWPKAGLSETERLIIRDLRRGMSAAFKDVVAKAEGRPWTVNSEPTSDGGVTLWPLYADVLTSAWREARMPKAYLVWRLIAEQDKKAGDVLLTALFTASLGGKSSVEKALPGALQLLRSGIVGASGTDYVYGTWATGAWDQRCVDQYLTMVHGWQRYVETPYVQFQLANLQPQWSTGKGLPVLPYGAINSAAPNLPSQDGFGVVPPGGHDQPGSKPIRPKLHIDMTALDASAAATPSKGGLGVGALLALGGIGALAVLKGRR